MEGNAPHIGKDKLSIGQAIDQVIDALSAFGANDQQTILKAVYSHLNISAPIEQAAATSPQPKHVTPDHHDRQPSSRAAASNEFAGMDIKTFKEIKKPTSARQMACVVAYFLAEIAQGEERKETVTSADIEKYFKQARFQLPTKLEQLLIDCKGSGYFDTPSRGEYKLTRVGYNLVAHQLPVKSKSS